jgi:hypothetical protein
MAAIQGFDFNGQLTGGSAPLFGSGLTIPGMDYSSYIQTVGPDQTGPGNLMINPHQPEGAPPIHPFSIGVVPGTTTGGTVRPPGYIPTSTTGPLSPPPLGGGPGGVQAFPTTTPFPAGAPNTNPNSPQGGGPDPFLAQIASNYNTATQQLLSGQHLDPLKQLLAGNSPLTQNLQQLLSGNSPLTKPLQDLIAAGGNPIDMLPAWQAMVDAQGRQDKLNAANLNEYFNVAGGRFSNAFGNSMGDYWTQTGKNQNALLAQMHAAAQEAAQGRVSSGAQTLAGIGSSGAQTLASIGGQGATSLASLGQQGPMLVASLGANAAGQLSSQDFASKMAQYQASLAAAQQMASGSDAAAAWLAGQSNNAGGAIVNNSIAANNTLTNNAVNAAGQLHAGQLSTLPNFMNYQLGLGGQNLAAGGQLSAGHNAGINAGIQLGGAQYGMQGNEIDRIYQEWLRTQPQYNPLLPYFYGASTAFPPMYTPGSKPGFWDYFAGIAGAGLQAAGTAAAGGAFSDRRLKSDIQRISALDKLDHLGGYTYKMGTHRRAGVMAQEIQTELPEAVVKDESTGMLMVDYNAVTALALQAVKELKAEVAELKRRLDATTAAA